MTRTHRAASGLVAGSVASGFLAYLLFALVTRGLGATAAAPVSVLWTHWAFTGAAFTFPLQHWITRSMVAGHEGQIRRAAARVTALVVVAALALGVLAWLLRDRLFHRDDAWFPAMVVLVTLGSAAVGVVRGSLAGRERFGSMAWSLVAENAVRCLLVAALLLLGVHDPVAHGLCLVAGSVVALGPTAWRFADDQPAGPEQPVSAFAFLGGAATGQLLGQGVLTGGPVLLALLGGSPREVTAMFAALALFRAPYMVVLGSVPQLTSRVTRHVVAGDSPALRRLAHAVGLLIVVAAPLAGVVGWLLGPAVLLLFFGATVDVDGVRCGVLATACTLAVANLVLMVTGLARDRAVGVALAWATAVMVGAVALVALVALGQSSPVDRSLSVFAVTEVAAMAALAAVALGSRGRVWRRIRRV